MANPVLPDITTGQALDALERHIQIRVMWMLKAQTMLQLIGDGAGDPKVLAGKCKELADSMPY